jgi:NAD(P)-dependent dehydrogenase (short-subunit alcohol dehydrogenase family)
MTDLAGTVALITGGAGAIGGAAAQIFAQRHAAVMVADLNEAAAAQMVEKLTAMGADAAFVVADVADPQSVQEMVARTVSRFGRLTYACNNAGHTGDSALLENQSIDSWNITIAISLSAVFYGMKYQLPAIIASGGGAIVNTSSTAGVRGVPRMSPYSAAKHGVNGLTKTAAIEYGPQGVRVNSVCPGGTHSAMNADWATTQPGAEEQLVGRTPLGRMAMPAEMGEAIVWLCSADASYVNGHELVVDGGMTAR